MNPLDESKYNLFRNIDGFVHTGKMTKFEAEALKCFAMYAINDAYAEGKKDAPYKVERRVKNDPTYTGIERRMDAKFGLNEIHAVVERVQVPSRG